MAYILLKEYYFKKKILSNFYTKNLPAKIMPQKLQILAYSLLLQNLCQTKNFPKEERR
jgi:hypothetical protein